MNWKPVMVVAALLAAIASVGCTGQPGASAIEAAKPTKEQLAAAEHAAMLADCASSRDSKMAEYTSLMGKREYWPASLTLRQCAEATQDAELMAKVAEAERRSYVADVQSTTVSRADKIRSLEAMATYYPDLAERFSALHKKLVSQEAKSIEARERKRRETEPPAMGSTMQQVAEGSWGYPARQNRTVTARGEYVQWVYDTGRYIYFENGVVVSWQD